MVSPVAFMSGSHAGSALANRLLELFAAALGELNPSMSAQHLSADSPLDGRHVQNTSVEDASRCVCMFERVTFSVN